MTMQVKTLTNKYQNRFAWRSYAWIIFAVIAAAALAAFYHDSYLMGVFASIVIFSIVLIGLDLVIGFGGLLAFSHGAFFALGAYVMGILSAKFGMPLLAGAAIAIFVNAAFAILIGIATIRLQGYYLAVATLGFGIMIVALLGAFVDITGGWSGLRGMGPLVLFDHRVTQDVEFYGIGVLFLIIGIAVARNIMNSRYGRAVRAAGSDSLAAEMLGIPTARIRLNLFVIGSVYASVAGSLYAAFLRVITPANFDVSTAIDMVLMMFLGGKETLWGPILGASILILLPELADGFSDYKTLVEGVVFVAVLMFFPSGIAGIFKKLFSKIGGRKELVNPENSQSETRPSIETAILQNVKGSRNATAADPNELGGPILRVDGLTKSFGGVAAVSNVSFDLQPGQLKAVIGPNGAGKTTLFNLLTGALRADSGSFELYGRPFPISRPHHIARQGVARTFQTPKLFANMTNFENVLIGHHTKLNAKLFNAVFPGQTTRAEEMEAAQGAQHLLECLGLAHLAHDNIESLAFGQRRLLEIARCLAMEPRILLLDEPAAGLNESEKSELAKLLKALQSTGMTLLLVEHDMPLVMSIADEIIVLDHGEKIAEGSPKQIRSDKAVLEAYLGAEVPHA